MSRIIGRRPPSTPEMFKHAEMLERRAKDPKDRDDPAWLLRRAKNVWLYARDRQIAHVKRVEERRKNLARHTEH